MQSNLMDKLKSCMHGAMDKREYNLMSHTEFDVSHIVFFLYIY